MIISFGSKETEKIWNGIVVKKPAIEIQQIARRKLRMLNNSQDLMDLRIPPSNRLEKLNGNLKTITAFELTINGELFLFGKIGMLQMSRL